MAVVSLMFAFVGGIFVWRESDATHVVPALISLGACLLLGCVWLFVNAAQGEAIRPNQNFWPAGAGLAGIIAVLFLPMKAVPTATVETVHNVTSHMAVNNTALLSISAVLGALLLGFATTAMLLGHRYLTDTNMPIAPLRRMAKFYIAVLALRFLWVAGASIPLWSSSFQSAGGDLYLWLAFCIRVLFGLIATSVFAWMAWDCIKRRATQSATAMFYLSMFLVFIGELSGQYLLHTEGLAL